MKKNNPDQGVLEKTLVDFQDLITEKEYNLSGDFRFRHYVDAEKIPSLLAQQHRKSSDATLNRIEAIWTRLMNETDDPVYKEIYASCIKALKI